MPLDAEDWRKLKVRHAAAMRIIKGVAPDERAQLLLLVVSRRDLP